MPVRRTVDHSEVVVKSGERPHMERLNQSEQSEQEREQTKMCFEDLTKDQAARGSELEAKQHENALMQWEDDGGSYHAPEEKLLHLAAVPGRSNGAREEGQRD